MLYDWNDDNLLTEWNGAINYNDCSKDFNRLNNEIEIIINSKLYLRLIVQMNILSIEEWKLIIPKKIDVINNYIQFNSNTIYIECWIDISIFIQTTYTITHTPLNHNNNIVGENEVLGMTFLILFL